jgi:hypothetical protein
MLLPVPCCFQCRAASIPEALSHEVAASELIFRRSINPHQSLSMGFQAKRWTDRFVSSEI